jgi:hypothetical protein
MIFGRFVRSIVVAEKGGRQYLAKVVAFLVAKPAKRARH